MSDLSSEKLIELLGKIPPHLVHILESKEFNETLLRLAKNFNLSFDGGKALDDVVTDVFFGILHPNDFQETLQKRIVTLSQDDFAGLVKAVDRQIFEPVRDALIKHVEEIKSGKDNSEEKMVPGPSMEDKSYEPQDKNVVEDGVDEVVDAPPKNNDALEPVQSRLQQSSYVPKETKVSKPKIQNDPYRETIE